MRSDTTHRSRACVWWTDCCVPRNVGGFNLIDHEEALHVMMAKWVIKVMSLGNTSFQKLFQYCIPLIHLLDNGNWPALSQWIVFHTFRATWGSKAWNMIVKSWWTMLNFAHRPIAKRSSPLTCGGQYFTLEATLAFCNNALRNSWYKTSGLLSIRSSWLGRKPKLSLISLLVIGRTIIHSYKKIPLEAPIAHGGLDLHNQQWILGCIHREIGRVGGCGLSNIATIPTAN